MSSADDKKAAGRRGAGRGRRQVPPQEQVPSRGVPEPADVETEMPGGRGRGRAVTTEARGPPPEAGSPESGSPKGSPHGSDVEEKMKNMQIIGLAARPGFGVAGSKGKVLANMFEVAINKELTVVQYEVNVTHERMKLNKDEKHRIFWTCIQDNQNVFRNPYRLLYDGGSLCFSLDRVAFRPGGESGEIGASYEVRVRLPRNDRIETFGVKFKVTGLVHVNMRDAKSASATGDRYTTPLQVFDLITRQRRCFPLDPATARDWYCFANTVYKVPPNGIGADLSGGRCIWQGLFGASRVGQGYIPYINFDVSHSGFYKPMPVLEYMIEVLNENFSRDRRRPMFSLEQLDGNTELQPAWVMAFSKAMKGMKVRTTTRRENGETMERELNVNGIIRDTAITSRFPRRDGGEMSVADYFAERYGALRYPKLNLLHVGASKKKCYMPLEHCMLAYNLRIKKLNPNDTSIMIKAAAINAPTRKKKVDDLVALSSFGNDPWLQQFGVRLNNQMKPVDARILPPPKIHYARNGGGRTGPVVEVREGIWDMRGQKFFLPASCKSIGALVLDDRDHNMYLQFFNFLLRTCHDLGMDVPPNIPNNFLADCSPNNIAGIEQAMSRLKSAGCEFLIVTLPQKSAPHYSEVKRVAEIVLGVMTQCVVKPNIKKCMEKEDRMTTANIALKMNMKMGGINSSAEADNLAKRTLLEEATLVLGIDVTHPSAFEKKMPSISSVVGNVDDSFMRYAAAVRVQKHRRESIVAGHLDQLVRERLVEYHKYVSEQNKLHKMNKPTQPKRIIIFRDGVAEGQFQEVLREELGGIREACKSLGADYKPKMTLIVAQKRHHTRFFPVPGGAASGKAMNIKPGTVVDSDITHPEQFEFYLCSHFGIQGTSRPIRYHVLHDDNNWSADHIQALTFYLCHVYARCTRAVSIPAPVYYADLACRRARAHIFDKVADFGSDTLSQRSGSGGETETAISEDELVRSSTLHASLNMRMYFT